MEVTRVHEIMGVIITGLVGLVILLALLVAIGILVKFTLEVILQ